jgi:hypothetical protein
MLTSASMSNAEMIVSGRPQQADGYTLRAAPLTEASFRLD